jgi:hypothetical protein
MLSSPSPLSCSQHLLAVSFLWISPLSITEHISKYSSIEKFMKLPFQHVVIHQKWSSTRELCLFYFSAVCCPKLISGRVALGDSGITTCRNLQLSWFLICWNCNFLGLLNIQKYSVFSLQDLTEFWWDLWLLAHWSRDVNDLDHSIF